MSVAKIFMWAFLVSVAIEGAAFAQSERPHPDSQECTVARRQNINRAVELGCFPDTQTAYTQGLMDGVEMTQQRQVTRTSPEQALAEMEADDARRQLRVVRECISRAQGYVFSPALTQTLYSTLARCERLAEGASF